MFVILYKDRVELTKCLRVANKKLSRIYLKGKENLNFNYLLIRLLNLFNIYFQKLFHAKNCI
ncbi:hypothetical protein CCAND95_430068 [Capnocytophaga canis]|uniref:Uncharacterized protein n=1 Tax=Capnocytophaga canis TaxID=1848903 RepID=A0A0B7I8A2_9FLAO|nr:hypothetical protein CCAND95_430068 [Capnocytophaga canis]CEN46919.1 hypothetical protein CCAND38_390002 [Capnocytophaga canis]